MAHLEIKDLRSGYGSLIVIENVSLEVRDGEIVALLGPNGAGKSTTLKAATGLLPTVAGTVYFDGRKVTGLPTHKIVRRGLSLVPEGRQLFPLLTVLENLQMGGYLISRRRVRKQRIESALEFFPMLREKLNVPAALLSGGQQQMLAIARGLVGMPKMLMIDEPSLGLAPIMQDQVRDRVAALRELGIAVLIVEQNVSMALSIADRAYVLRSGRIVMSGTATELRGSGAVHSEYMGQRA